MSEPTPEGAGEWGPGRRRPSGCPILIFTHDIVFTLELQKAAAVAGVPLQSSQIRRTANAAGEVLPALPWEGQGTKQRVGQLRALHQEAKTAHDRGDQEDYERRAKETYGFLRDAWERGVGEVLLCDAIIRYGPDLRTKSLRKIHRLTEGHLAPIEEGMTKTSRWLRRHDDPGEVNEPVPEPDEVKADIGKLDDWRRSIIDLYA